MIGIVAILTIFGLGVASGKDLSQHSFAKEECSAFASYMCPTDKNGEMVKNIKLCKSLIAVSNTYSCGPCAPEDVKNCFEIASLLKDSQETNVYRLNKREKGEDPDPVISPTKKKNVPQPSTTGDASNTKKGKAKETPNSRTNKTPTGMSGSLDEQSSGKTKLPMRIGNFNSNINKTAQAALKKLDDKPDVLVISSIKSSTTEASESTKEIEENDEYEEEDEDEYEDGDVDIDEEAEDSTLDEALPDTVTSRSIAAVSKVVTGKRNKGKANPSAVISTTNSKTDIGEITTISTGTTKNREKTVETDFITDAIPDGVIINNTRDKEAEDVAEVSNAELSLNISELATNTIEENVKKSTSTVSNAIPVSRSNPLRIFGKSKQENPSLILTEESPAAKLDQGQTVPPVAFSQKFLNSSIKSNEVDSVSAEPTPQTSTPVNQKRTNENTANIVENHMKKLKETDQDVNNPFQPLGKPVEKMLRLPDVDNKQPTVFDHEDNQTDSNQSTQKYQFSSKNNERGFSEDEIYKQTSSGDTTKMTISFERVEMRTDLSRQQIEQVTSGFSNNDTLPLGRNSEQINKSESNAKEPFKQPIVPKANKVLQLAHDNKLPQLSKDNKPSQLSQDNKLPVLSKDNKPSQLTQDNEPQLSKDNKLPHLSDNKASQLSNDNKPLQLSNDNKPLQLSEDNNTLSLPEHDTQTLLEQKNKLLPSEDENVQASTQVKNARISSSTPSEANRSSVGRDNTQQIYFSLPPVDIKIKDNKSFEKENSNTTSSEQNFKQVGLPQTNNAQQKNISSSSVGHVNDKESLGLNHPAPSQRNFQQSESARGQNAVQMSLPEMNGYVPLAMKKSDSSKINSSISDRINANQSKISILPINQADESEPFKLKQLALFGHNNPQVGSPSGNNAQQNKISSSTSNGVRNNGPVGIKRPLPLEHNNPHVNSSMSQNSQQRNISFSSVVGENNNGPRKMNQPATADHNNQELDSFESKNVQEKQVLSYPNIDSQEIDNVKLEMTQTLSSEPNDLQPVLLDHNLILEDKSAFFSSDSEDEKKSSEMKHEENVFQTTKNNRKGKEKKIKIKRYYGEKPRVYIFTLRQDYHREENFAFTPRPLKFL